jgi:site-specific recombinase XerD
VPMSPRLAGVLLEPTIRALGQPTLITMKDRLARRSITRLGKRAGIAYDVASHQLRATFATHLSAIGVPLRTIQEILGHANVTQTEVYTAVNLQQMADAVKDL